MSENIATKTGLRFFISNPSYSVIVIAVSPNCYTGDMIAALSEKISEKVKKMSFLKIVVGTLLVIGGALLLIFFPHSKKITDSEYTNKTGFATPMILCGIGLPGINYSAIAEQKGFPLAAQSKYYFQDDCENNITIRSSASGAIINGIVGALAGTIIFLSGSRLGKRIFK